MLSIPHTKAMPCLQSTAMRSHVSLRAPKGRFPSYPLALLLTPQSTSITISYDEHGLVYQVLASAEQDTFRAQSSSLRIENLPFELLSALLTSIDIDRDAFAWIDKASWRKCLADAPPDIKEFTVSVSEGVRVSLGSGENGLLSSQIG